MLLAPELDSPKPATDRTLFELLAATARRMPTARLRDFFIIGAYGALGVGVFAAPWWLLAMPLVCLAAFGAWGLAERKVGELAASQDQPPAWRVALRAAAATAVVTGVAAALIVIFAVFLTLSGPAPIS